MSGQDPNETQVAVENAASIQPPEREPAKPAKKKAKAKKEGPEVWLWKTSVRHDGQAYAEGDVCELKGSELAKMKRHGLVVLED